MKHERQLTEQVDFFVAYKFIKILTKDFKDTDAFKLGIIDKDGKILKKRKDLKSGEEKVAYTIFHTLIWNVKKLLSRVPGLKSKLGSYAAALFLLKESCRGNKHGEQNVHELVEYIKRNETVNDIDNIFENNFSDILPEGVYITTQEIVTPDFETMNEGDVIVVGNDIKPFVEFEGVCLYEAMHMNSGKNIIVNKSIIEMLSEDITTAPETFAGATIFDIDYEDVSTKHTSSVISPSRQKFERWNKSLNMDNDSNQRIKKYIHRNPSKDVIVRNKMGNMSYFYKVNKK